MYLGGSTYERRSEGSAILKILINYTQVFLVLNELQITNIHIDFSILEKPSNTQQSILDQQDCFLQDIRGDVDFLVF